MSHCVYHPQGLSTAQFGALLAVVSAKGRHWRTWLAEAWETGVYAWSGSDRLDDRFAQALDLLRNTIGTEGIQDIRLTGPVAVMETV